MSAMADLDITLSQYKLSDAQKNAVVELLDGPTTAKVNTLKSLEKRGILTPDTSVEGLWQFTDQFVKESGLFSEADYDGIDDVQLAESYRQLVDNLRDEAPLADGVEYYQSDWADWEKELAGFGALSKWRNTQVWDGLTAEEIRKDMDTARPVGRAARRADAKIARKLIKSL